MITIRDISRSGHITRWHMVRTQREQTLAEHLYLVTMYADEIARKVLNDYSDSDRLKLLSWTLEHDTPEILTGDIPTPAKRCLQQAYTDGNDPLEQLEDSIASENYKRAKKDVDDTHLEIITKLADLIDGITFVHIEGATTHSEVIELKLIESFHNVVEVGKQKYPAHKWNEAKSVLDDILNGKDGQLEFEADF